MIKKISFLLIAMIGCGYLAITLMAPRNVYPATNEEYADLLVAAMELPIGTKLEKEKLPELIKKRKVRKSDIPLNAIVNEDELIGKTVTIRLSAEDYFTVSCVLPVCSACIAPEKQLYSIKLPYESVGPWVQAGKEVEVVCTHRPTGASVVRHVRILHKLPVVAVDYWDKPEPIIGSKPMFVTVTLVASLEESHWMQIAQNSGAWLRLLIDDGCGKFTKPSDEELYELFKGISKETKNRQENK